MNTMNEVTMNEVTMNMQEKRPELTFSFQKIWKNGTQKEALVISDGISNINPTIYYEDLLAGKTIEQAAEDILAIYEQHKELPFHLDLEEVLSREYILSHVYPTLQRASKENCIKRDTPFPGVESVLVLKGEDFSIKVTQGLLDSKKIYIPDIWTVAQENLEKAVVIKSMAQTLQELDVVPEDILEEAFSMPKMYVVTTTDKVKGAVAVLTKTFETFCLEHGFKEMHIIPSSIHECLAIPPKDSLTSDTIDAMVKDVNETQVAPHERLADQSFFLSFGN